LFALVVKNGSRACSGSTDRPGPSSSTLIESWSAAGSAAMVVAITVAPARTEFSRMSRR
jgi:hypothetical protein